MCVAAPMKVIEIDGETVRAELGGTVKEARLVHVDNGGGVDDSRLQIVELRKDRRAGVVHGVPGDNVTQIVLFRDVPDQRTFPPDMGAVVRPPQQIPRRRVGSSRFRLLQEISITESTPSQGGRQ